MRIVALAKAPADRVRPNEGELLMGRAKVRQRVAGVAAAATLVTVLVGGSGTATAGAATGHSAKGTPIGLVEFGATTLTDSATADGWLGVQTEIKYINSHGGVKGRPLVANYCYDNHDVSQATTCADKEISDPSIIASVNQWGALTPVIDPLLQNANMAQVGGTPLSSTDFTSPISFAFSSGTFGGLGGIAAIPDQLHGKKISVLYPESLAGATLVGLVNSAVLKPRGLSLMDSVPMSTNVTDESPYVSRADAGSPSAIFVFFGAAVANSFVTTARQLGVTAPIILAGADETSARVKQQLGGSTKNLYFWNYFHDGGSGYNALASVMTAEGQSASKLNDNVIGGMLSVKLFAQVANKLPTVTRAGVLDALNNLSSFDTGGITPPISFTTPGTGLGGKAPRVFNVTSTLYTYAHGKIEPYKGSPFINPFLPPKASKAG